MSVTSYPTLRLKLTMPQALKLQFLPAIPGSNAAASAAAAQAAADAAAAAANTATAATANKVDKSGDVMTGFLTLNANPNTNLQAATKQYVDGADATKVNKVGDVMTGFLTLNANPTAVLHAATKQYVDSAVSAGGIAEAPSDGLLYGRLSATWARAQPFDGDLASLAAATGNNTIYYRSGTNTWSPVVVGATMTFVGGTLNTTAGGGNVLADGVPTFGQWARWTTAATIEGVDAANTGFQPLDADLTSIASATVTNQWLYRSAANTWSPVAIGANLTFTGGTLAATGGGGGAGVTISDTPPGSPTNGSLWWESDTGGFYISYTDVNSTQWVALNSQGSLSGGGGGGGVPEAPINGLFYARKDASWLDVATAFAPLASAALTGSPTAPTATPATDSTTKLATTAFVQAAIAAALATVSRGAPGDIRWGFDSVPQSWEVELNGATITNGVTLYPDVASRYPFMVSGSNLRLPDARGCFPRIWAHGQGTDPDRAARTASFPGGPTGDNPASVQGHQFLSHSHVYTTMGNTLQVLVGAGYTYDNFTQPLNTSAAGGNETRPLNMNFSAFMRVL